MVVWHQVAGLSVECWVIKVTGIWFHDPKICFSLLGPKCKTMDREKLKKNSIVLEYNFRCQIVWRLIDTYSLVSTCTFAASSC